MPGLSAPLAVATLLDGAAVMVTSGPGMHASYSNIFIFSAGSGVDSLWELFSRQAKSGLSAAK